MQGSSQNVQAEKERYAGLSRCEGYDVEKWSREELDHFETEYFNTGSEWIVHDEKAEPESPEDISGYSVYCHGWNNDQIKEEIAEAQGKKAEEVEVVLFAFKTYARTPVYEAV